MIKLYPTDFSISLHRVSIAVTGDRHRYVIFFLAVKLSAKTIVQYVEQFCKMRRALSLTFVLFN